MSEDTPGAGQHARPGDGSGDQTDTGGAAAGETGDAPEAGGGFERTASSAPTARFEGSVDPDEPATDDTTIDSPAPGRIRYQDPETTTPRAPTVAEQRARQEAQRRREAQDQAAIAAEERRRKVRKRVLVGGGVAVGIVAVVAIAYAASSSDGDAVDAQCTDQHGVVVDDRFCSGNSVGGSYGGGFVPIFLGGFGNQYHYNYGSNSPIGTVARGGSTTPPANGTSIRSGTSGSSLGNSSNGTVSRGGLGVGSSSGSSGSSGSSSGSSGGSEGGSSSGS